MNSICDAIKRNTDEIIAEWEVLVREQPWFSLPAEHRIDHLPDVIIGLVESSLCNPVDPRAHRQNVEAACTHGVSRREQGIPEHLMFTEYHLIRQAIWYFLQRNFPPTDELSDAILRIDGAISLATNASMWGYHRAEIEALGKWDEGIERIITSSPFLANQETLRR
jgi:hypothetical protein